MGHDFHQGQSPSAIAHDVLREVAASPHHSLESRQQMALLAALVEIGDRLRGIEKTLDLWVAHGNG